MAKDSTSSFRLPGFGHRVYKNYDPRARICKEACDDVLKILGIHCFGNNASEIVHIGQAIMSQKGIANTLMFFINTTFNYPTMAEAYRVAALNGINRVDQLKKKAN